VRYLTADTTASATQTGLTITGGTVTTSGNYTIHTFTSTSSLVIS
jgi:hypothetical protein